MGKFGVGLEIFSKKVVYKKLVLEKFDTGFWKDKSVDSFICIKMFYIICYSVIYWRCYGQGDWEVMSCPPPILFRINFLIHPNSRENIRMR